MNAVIVCCFHTYLSRAKLLKKAYERMGYHVQLLSTDFDHVNKGKVSELEKDIIYVSTKPYFKNLSPQRLYSHHAFAKEVFGMLKDADIDLLHVLIPANSLAKEAYIYIKNHRKTKLYFDIIDLWPETMPMGKLKKAYPFEVWRKLRDDHIDKADIVYTECDLYQKVLGKTEDIKYRTLYWIKPEEMKVSNPKIDMNTIHLCYLGSINNIIDIDYIVDLCSMVNKHKACKLHIIGTGEKKIELLDKLKANLVDFIDYGIVYDSDKKQEIFDKCHFGLNIMKSTVCVGLTMKSLDYFLGGLPIINNLVGDTSEFVNQYKIGFNGCDEFEKHIDVLEEADYLSMREHVKILYSEKFTEEVFHKVIFDTEEQVWKK